MNIHGKKLLVLGSTRLIGGIVTKARQLGVHTIVTDNRPLEKAPAKLLADEYRDIDFSDIDAIVRLVREERIDGVLTGFTDSYMPFYLRICEEAGLPCYGDARSIAIATEKSVFKEACTAAGVPVIPGISTSELAEAEAFTARIGFPVMLKPVDNSGSRGVIRCSTQGDLAAAFDYAMSFSASKKIMVEKYLDCDNVAISYFAAGGDVRLSTTDDRLVYKAPDSGSSVSAYSEYPSRYTRRYIDEVDDAVVRMLKANGFRNGMIALQAFVDDSSFYFCEMCYRPSGGQHYQLVQDQTGVDELALLIQFAVTGECAQDWDADRETPWFREHYGMLRILGTPGERIARMDGFEALSKLPRVLRASAALSVGTVIGKAGTTAQVIGSVLYKFSPEEGRRKVADDMLAHLDIENEKGESIAWISTD